jgi:hypothetical protein
MRFIVFDDALKQNDTRWTADDFAASLRTPLAAIGVSVVRRHGLGGTGFQAQGISAKTHNAKSEKVRHIVESVLNLQVSQETSTQSKWRLRRRKMQV